MRGRWIGLLLLICCLEFPVHGQPAILEIRQSYLEDFVEWNIYDSFDHLILAGSAFSPDELISLLLESNKRYVLEVIASGSS
ncbi:MAG: hypothetical protein KAT15_10655, partial [Bacteroidales bacterium]|nr:hypothetical protein [Bacteroidales bacterium]